MARPAGPSINPLENRRDDFGDASLHFGIVRDRPGDRNVAGGLGIDAFFDQLAGVNQETRADSFLEAVLPEGTTLSLVARKAAPTPATGYYPMHVEQERQLLERAFARTPRTMKSSRGAGPRSPRVPASARSSGTR